jgi:hypothetical protein
LTIVISSSQRWCRALAHNQLTRLTNIVWVNEGVEIEIKFCTHFPVISHFGRMWIWYLSSRSMRHVHFFAPLDFLQAHHGSSWDPLSSSQETCLGQMSVHGGLSVLGGHYDTPVNGVEHCSQPPWQHAKPWFWSSVIWPMQQSFEFFTLPHTFGWSPRTPAGLHPDSARISYIDVPFKIFQNMLVNSGRSPSRLQMESTYYVYPTWINPRKKVHPDSIRTPPRIRNMVGLQHKSN